jgi:broad specificity phosphatase PhoE
VLSLYLLRHGETEFSQHDRFCGRIDAPLTGNGREMATSFAAAYGNLSWRAITTSTRARAIDSAAPLAALVGIDPCADERLDEMHYGAWQGLSKEEAAAQDREYFARWQRDPSIGPPMGESPREVAIRAAATVMQLRERYAEGNVLIVSHKALLRILLCALFDTELRHYRCGPTWPAGAVTQIDLGAGRPSLRLFADVAHLGARDQSDRRTPPLRAASA